MMLLACAIAWAQLFSVPWAFSRASKTDYGCVPRYFVLKLLRDRQFVKGRKMREFNTTIINKAIDNLEMSLEFKQAAAKQGYKVLADIVNIRTADLEKKPGFNILLVHEYVSFMESAGLGALIDPTLI